MGIERRKWAYILRENENRIMLENGLGYLLLEDQRTGYRASPWTSTALSLLIFIFAGLYL